jgi:pilus assembly protein CpaC
MNPQSSHLRPSHLSQSHLRLSHLRLSHLRLSHLQLPRLFLTCLLLALLPLSLGAQTQLAPAPPPAQSPAPPQPAPQVPQPAAPPRRATPRHIPILAPYIESATAADVVHITVGQSVMLTSAAALRRVYVGNPAVLQTYTAGTNQIVLTAKGPGVSSLVLWGDAAQNRLYTVYADADPESLATSLDQAIPGSRIKLAVSRDKIYLTGTVASQADSDTASKMASTFSFDVVNSLRILPPPFLRGKQVELKLRIVEVDRTKLEQLGINIFAGGRTNVSTTTQQFASGASAGGSSVSVSDPLNLFLYNAKLNLGLTVKDLEERQVLQVLAEPTITTLSGVSAQFLSGGEFPFPVVQGGVGSSTAITIQFRPYGVKVAFTPTVNPDGSIHLKLAPEVSTLDYSNSVTISGFLIPALSTRRADTEVELQDGQSFVVSGLLDHRTTEIMSKVPGIANIPILGELFRSKNFNHSIVELVIIVTATVVDPLSAQPPTAIHEPTFVVPNMEAPAFDASTAKTAKTAAQSSHPAAPAGTPAVKPADRTKP